MEEIIERYNEILQYDPTNPQYHQEILRKIGKLEHMFEEFRGDICDFVQEFLATPNKYPTGMEYYVKSHLYKRAMTMVDCDYGSHFRFHMGDKVLENVKIAEILEDNSILDYTESYLICRIKWDLDYELLSHIPNVNPDKRNGRLVYQYLLETENLAKIYNNLCEIPGKRAKIARRHVELKLSPSEIMSLPDE